MGSDYGHRQKTTGAIQSRGPWDTLSIDIVGPLPAYHRQEFHIVFVDCYSRYTILVPSSNHTANTVNEALLRHVVPYFCTPRRLPSDQGREFVSEIWSKLLRSLGIQWVLTSPYHPEGNAINERSHRTLNNMLCACLLKGSSSKARVDKVPGIMLSLNAMPHEPHGFSAPMVATGREPTLPSWCEKGRTCLPGHWWSLRICGGHHPAVAADPPTDGFTIPSLCRQPIPGGESHLCDDHPSWARFQVVSTVERLISCLSDPQWLPDSLRRKPAKFNAPGLPEPMPAPDIPRPPLGYLPPGLLGPRPPPPASAAPAGDSSSSSTTASTAPQPTTPSESKMQPPATTPANQRTRTRSSSMTISQTQPWAWPIVCYKRPTRKPTSPVWKSCKDGQDLSFDCALQPVSRCPRWSVIVCQPALSGPQKRAKPVFKYSTAAGGRSAQNGRTLLALRARRSHRSPTPEMPATLDAGSDLVAVAIGWPLSPRCWLLPVLSHTPGTACGLTRGWCDPAALGKVSELGPWPFPSSHSIPWWPDLPCTFREPRKYAATRRLSQASTEVAALSS